MCYSSCPTVLGKSSLCYNTGEYRLEFLVSKNIRLHVLYCQVCSSDLVKNVIT